MKKRIILAALLAALAFSVSLFLLTKHTHTFGEEIPVGKTDKGYMFIQTCSECGQSAATYYDALLTFVDDDGKTQAMLHWERIIDATGIKMTAAIIPGKIEETTDYDSWWSYAGWDLLDRLGSKGVDFVHHTYSHINLTTLTEEEIHVDLQKSIATLYAHGIDSDVLVYPNNAYNEKVLSVVSSYFDAAFTCGGKVVTDPDAIQYKINRVDINDKNLEKTIRFDAERTVTCKGVKSADILKTEMQGAISKEGWLVYMVHAYDSPGGKYYFDEVSEQSIIDFCLHVQTLENVKIVTLSEGLVAASAIEP